MGYPSSPVFMTFHSLRIKGFATTDTLADMTALEESDVAGHLGDMQADGHAQFREARSLWQLTPAGREAHPELLAADLGGADVHAELGEPYRTFLGCNGEFKELCGAWQLRDGAPNDHTDAGYDGAVIERLVVLHGTAMPVAAEFGERFDRFMPYAQRLERVLARLRSGESNMFTGVMCGSYHDVWMELHEDLILTQGIDRTAEGSF
jgi:hypothetical protein